MYSFQVEPEFQKELDWIKDFVADRVAPLDVVLGAVCNIHDPLFQKHVRPLQKIVKERGLWACHLGPELGGKGYGQLKLALMNEQLGQSRFGPIVFGVQAPDTGNSEILAHYGTEEQKRKYLEPLLNNEIVSCFAMTEPQGGADPLQITTTAKRSGDEWVINGEKWFASNARYSAFFIVMVETEPAAENRYERQSMFIVPAETPGLEIVREYGHLGGEEPDHAHLRFNNVRVPADHILGEPGEAFVVAQVRLGGGRLHHAMRALAQASRCLNMTCERVLSRQTKGQPLWKQQSVQEKIADAWIQLRQFRLLVLETAWLADQNNDWKAVRQNVSAVKALMPQVLNDIASMSLHLHGSLGLSTDMPFGKDIMSSYMLGLADGPTEVHKGVVAKELLKEFHPTQELFPDYIRWKVEARAKAQLGIEEQ